MRTKLSPFLFVASLIVAVAVDAVVLPDNPPQAALAPHNSKQFEANCVLNCGVFVTCALVNQDLDQECCDQLVLAAECALESCEPGELEDLTGVNLDDVTQGDVCTQLPGSGNGQETLAPGSTAGPAGSDLNCALSLAGCLQSIVNVEDLANMEADNEELCASVNEVYSCALSKGCTEEQIQDTDLPAALGDVNCSLAAAPVSSTNAASVAPLNPTFSSDESDSSADCFPGHMLVETENGFTRIDQLQRGQSVRVAPGTRGFSPVFFWSHRDSSVTSRYYLIQTTEENPLEASSRHLLFTDLGIKEARFIKPGDKLVYGPSGELVDVTSVTTVTRSGVFHPHTMHGDIVVNGYLASTMTGAVPIQLAKVLLFPEQLAFRLGTSLYGSTLHGDSWMRQAFMRVRSGSL